MADDAERESKDLTVREVFNRDRLGILQKKLEDYRSRYNFLSPVDVIESIPDYSAISAVTVPVDTRDAKVGGEVYEQGWAKEIADKKWSLAKAPIERIAMAGGADIISTTRVDDRTIPDYCEFTAVALIPDVGSGRSRRQPGTAEIDLRDGSPLCRKMIRENETSYQRLLDRAKRENWSRPPTKKDPQVRIDEMRATIVRRCETAAILRAYRRGFGIKPHYTHDDLMKPFLILRLVESSYAYTESKEEALQAREDYRRMTLARMAGAQDMLFGYREQRPREVVPATAIPVEDKVERDTEGAGEADIDAAFEDPFDDFNGGGR